MPSAEINTRLTSLLGIKKPIILPPMANVSHPGLISAVTSAGSFGFVGAGSMPPNKLVDAVNEVRSKLSMSPQDKLPAGVGFMTWVLERDAPDATFDPRLEAVLQENIQAVWFAFGEDSGRYVKQTRKHSPETAVFVLVNSVEEALRATHDWKVDVLVVQGSEAGGHGGSQAPPLSALLTGIVNAIPDATQRPVIVAAGGIATGAQVASALALGADGVAVGTRLLMTPESGYPSKKKDALVQADLHATGRSRAFDELNGTVGWPAWTDGRGIAGEILKDVEAGLDLKTRLAKAEDGGIERTTVWAGQGVGLTNKIQDAEDVIRELHDDAVKAIQNSASMLKM